MVAGRKCRKERNKESANQRERRGKERRKGEEGKLGRRVEEGGESRC